MDGVGITPGIGTVVSTEEIDTLNGGAVPTQHVQRIALVGITADGQVVDLGSTGALPVDGSSVVQPVSGVDGEPIVMALSEDVTAEIVSLPLPTDASTESTQSAVLAAVNAVEATISGTPAVELGGATATAIADAATATATKYVGVTVANTSTTARAEVRVRNTNVSGTILDSIHLGPGESVSYTYPRGRTAASGTIYIQVVSGAVEGSIFSVA